MGCCGSSAVDDEEHLDYSSGRVTIIPDLKCWEQKLEEANELGQTVVVKFSATWCGPCRNAAPLYAELSLKHSDLVFFSIDVDELPVRIGHAIRCTRNSNVHLHERHEGDRQAGRGQPGRTPEEVRSVLPVTVEAIHGRIRLSV
ncbi:Thioredoxin [Zea mays]|uniref:Thioredoxin n=1 Tax=Zea mays TaxID=4577 RepID=A0A1D6M6M3_MAIZE|nr:Thioredoxin [Zea mays]AQK86726.1 Thioredoxin [Zea mays]